MQDEAMSTVLQGGERSRRAGVISSPEDQNGLREALARHFDGSAFQPAHSADQYWGQRRRDAYRHADDLIAGPLASLIAERDAAVAKMKTFAEAYVVVAETAETEEARARAAEAELDEERQESARLALAVSEGQAEITRLKEGMEAALAKAFDAGFDISAEGWNAEHGVDRPEDDEGYRIACERAVARLLATLSPKEQP